MITAEKNKTISIKKTFGAPIYSIWKAWAEPESFKKWWGPQDFTCPYCSIDFWVGGKYLACMRGPDGKEFWSTGIYKEITPFKKIICTDSFSDPKGNIIPASDLKMPGEWPLQLLVTLKFEEAEGKTNVRINHEGIPAEMFNDCIIGWQQSLDKMEKNIK